MKFENTRIMNFECALHGMRNPKNSWDKSDSYFGLINTEWSDIDYTIANYWIKSINSSLKEDSNEYFKLSNEYSQWLIKNGILQWGEDTVIAEVALLGPNDMKLAQNLIKAGPEHRKFMRQIFVSVDITAPLYIWKELDTYKIGTTTNSTSTMHKLASTPITMDCFEIDDLYEEYTHSPTINFSIEDDLIPALEELRQKYLKTKDKKYWKELVRWLPESWLQTRTWTANYEILLNICRQRNRHKLTEWNSFINWVKELPYNNELIFCNETTF